MPNVPSQFPNYAFPQAEYFNLAPNAQIALGQRLSRNVLGNSVVVPASSGLTVNINYQIVDNWGFGDAIYISRAYLLFVVGDNSGAVQVQQARIGVGSAPTNIALDLGVPLLTFAQPPNAQVAIYDRDALITQVDTSPVMALNLPLNFIGQLTLHNTDAGAGHFVAAQLVIVYHQLKGFTQ